MKKSTSQKHKTQNYKLVTRRVTSIGAYPTTRAVSIWEPVPLRASRKDLFVGQT